MPDKAAKTVIEDDDDDFELITSSAQLGASPKLRMKEVKVREWPTASGKGAKFLAWEMSAGEYRSFLDSGWTYKDGVRQSYDDAGEQLRFVAFGIRDQHGNRIWPTVDAAKAQLDPLGRPTLMLLLNAINEVNSARKVATEGNSEGTPTAS